MSSTLCTDLYLIRHGIAAERGTYANDDDRPLISKGRDRTQQVANRLKSLGLTFDALLTSPLVRAQQTAAILQAAGLCQQVQIHQSLAPGGAIAPWLTWLAEFQAQATEQSSQTPAQRPATLALVGHEPDLSQWAQQLVEGKTHDRWLLKKAGILGLRLPAASASLGNSELFLLIPPRFLL